MMLVPVCGFSDSLVVDDTANIRLYTVFVEGVEPYTRVVLADFGHNQETDVLLVHQMDGSIECFVRNGQGIQECCTVPNTPCDAHMRPVEAHKMYFNGTTRAWNAVSYSWWNVWGVSLMFDRLDQELPHALNGDRAAFEAFVRDRLSSRGSIATE